MSADRMWTTLIGGFVGTAYHPDTIAAEVVFADIARGAPPAGEAELLTEILTAEGWTHHGGPVPSESVGPLAGDVLADLTALGAFTYDATRRGSSTTVPSPDGVRLGAALLRHRLLHTQMPSL